jgi:TonB family protein
MKRCKACGENFESQFSFCPVDGSSLVAVEAVADCEYRLTLLSDERLTRRLAREVAFGLAQLERAWPRFKADPFTFTRDQFDELKRISKRAWSRHLTAGLITSAAAVFCLILSVFLLEKHAAQRRAADEAGDLLNTVTIDFHFLPNESAKPGLGAGEKGRAGFENGRGQGSRPTPARAQGGGGGGDHAQLPPSQGRLPQPSVIPAPIPTTYARLPPQALPAAGIDIDPVLWKDLPFPAYGDPRSKSSTPSNGPGAGGGVGTNQGPGIGEGNGPGFGPGRKGNMGGGDNSPGGGGKGGAPGDNPNGDLDRIYRPAEVTVRAQVLFKPEPQYTEEARRSQITGTVILSVVFSRSGQVTNIRAVQTLCCGLTEKAIASARQIRFVPATRNGQTVSTYMQLEYNFNLY